VITDPFFYAAAIPAVILLGLSKGGFSGISVLAVPLMTLVISPVQAASITLPILLVQDAISVWIFRRSWDGKSLAILLPSALVGIVLGYLLAARVSSAAVELAIGVVSIVFGVQQFLKQRHIDPQPLHASTPVGVACGVTAGFTSQIAHAGAVPFQLYMLPKRLERLVLVGTSSLFFASVNWMKVPFYAALGQFTRANLATSIVLFPLAIASTLAGAVLVKRVSGERFYTVMYVLLVVVGIKLTWDGARSL